MKDVITSANQIVDGVKESTGIDLQAILSGAAGGHVVAKAMEERPTAEV